MSSDTTPGTGSQSALGPGARPNSGRLIVSRATWLTVFLVVEVFAVAAFQTPLQRFDRLAFFDAGGELAIQDLINRGYRPAVDFGYQYGLLPLLIDRLWYGLAGLEPSALRVEVTACMILSAWGLARFAANRRTGPIGVVLIALAIPDLIFVTYMTVVQALEQALLFNALAEQARGRRALALSLVTACCFVKPSLAYFQGLAVLIAIVACARRANLAAWARALGPAVVTAALLAAILAMSFGLTPLARTVFPRTGLAAYRINDLGFFRAGGRGFWYLPGAGLLDYFRYEVGFWALGTVFLTWGGVAGLLRLARGASTFDRAIDDEVIATCAAVHLGFVVFLFGHRATWIYSLPMLILGLAALANRGPWHKAVLWGLAVLLLVNDRSKAAEVKRRWNTDAPSALTLGLWTSPQERAEWVRARELTRGRQTVLLAMCDGAALLTPGFAPPVGAYFVPGNPLPAEVRRKAEQIAAAQMVISAHPPDWLGFEFWPELTSALDGCELLMNGRSLWVYGREVTGPPAKVPSPIAR